MKIIEKQIKEWKEKHGGVYQIEVDDKVGILRAPKMKDFKRGFSALQDDSEVAFGEEMLSTLWLGGDEELRKDDEYFLSARKEVSKLLKYDDAEIIPCDRDHIIKIGDEQVTVRVITREDLKLAEKKNPSQKPFVTQEALFDLIKIGEVPAAFEDRDNAEIRFPLYGAIQKLQNKKVSQLKKL